jgi:hypothetical protein
MQTIFIVDLHNDGRYPLTEPQCDHPELKRGQFFRRKHRTWRVSDRQVLEINGQRTQKLCIAPADTLRD